MNTRTPANPDFTGRTVLVVGLARSGEAAARLLRKHGARVIVADRKSRAELGAPADALEALGVEVRGGDPGADTLTGIDLVVLSPGVPATAPLPAAALAAGVPLIGEVELAARYARARIVAVTGTNGKSTTVTLIGHLLTALGIPNRVCGNVGLAMAAVVEEVPADGVLVVEVSSFQLESLATFRPEVGVVLNLTPDHLDRYPSLPAYYGAKENLFRYQTAEDVAILNAEDATLMTWAPRLAARLFTFGEKRVENGPAVENGAALENDAFVVRRAGASRRVMGRAELGIPGPHNAANALAALAALEGLGLDAAAPAVAEALRHFPGLEHRIEYSGTLNGVRFYNDSKATNTDSMAVALRSFSEPIVLIAGGRDKKGDFAGLLDRVQGRVATVVTIGEAGPTIRAAWGGAVDNWVEAGRSFERAVEAAYQEATARGGIVLLSPGCASYDMFRDYEDRGRRFKTLVAALGAELRGN